MMMMMMIVLHFSFRDFPLYGFVTIHWRHLANENEENAMELASHVHGLVMKQI